MPSQDVASADMNGDGISDAIAASETSLTVQLGLEGGGFGPPLTQRFVQGSIVAGVSTLLVADWNADGHPDVAAANFDFRTSGRGIVAFLPGNGDGTLGSPVRISPGFDPQSLASGDFDGDGKLDVAVGAFTGAARVRILIGNGDGSFRTGSVFATAEWGGAKSLLAHDFSGDGRPDLAVASGSGTVSLVINAGGGEFLPPNSVSVIPAVSYLVSGDFNGDGRPDLIALGDGATVVIHNTSDGLRVSGRYAGGLSPIPFDLDGDGKLDLLALSRFGNGFLIIRGGGDGTLSAPAQYGLGDISSQPSALDIVAADFNGDGRTDLATSNLLGDVSVLLATPGGFAAPIRVGAGPAGRNVRAERIVALDFDEDGRVDLVTTDDWSGVVTLLRGTGDGRFVMSSTLPAGQAPVGIVAADLNGDARTDLATAGGSGISVLLRAPNGGFQPAVSYSAGPVPLAIASADFNADGRVDLAVVSRAETEADGVVSILIGSAGGSFRKNEDYAVGVRPSDLAIGDLNRDGIPDIAVSSFQGLTVLVGKGDGKFVSVAVTRGYFGSGPISVADINRDGLPDLVVALPGGLSVYFGNGDASFQPRRDLLSTSSVRSAFVVRDFDGDGLPDMAVISAKDVTILQARARTSNLVSVSAASLEPGSLSPDAIVAGFGVRLATTTQVPPEPSESVAGTSVRVRDAADVERAAKIFFVSPGQVNYLIPAETAPGMARVTITSGDGFTSTSVVPIDRIAPALFILSPIGLAAANIVRVRASGDQIVEAIFEVDASTGRLVARPIDLGPPGERVFLQLYGTGIRGRDPGEPVRARIGGIPATVVSYAGPQGEVPGLDQVNVLLPAELRGLGDVDIVVGIGDVPSNRAPVRIR